MGRASNKKDKNIYQIYREEQGLTREKASDLMDGMTPSRIEKIEKGQEPTPYDILQMADCYKHPDLCNYYCSHRCAIGDKYVPEIELSSLPNIILETIASLNDIAPYTNLLIQIGRDGVISDNEIPKFAYISAKLENIARSVDSLKLWIEKTANEDNLNMDLFRKELEKLNNEP